jgi:orotate phosphoribosyltransferase
MEAVREGHFVGTSGKHLSAYVQKDVPTTYPRKLRVLAEGIAQMVHLLRPNLVVAPPMGALLLGGMVAEELAVRYIYLEKTDGELGVLRSYFRQLAGDAQVCIVEDIITTGKTSRSSIHAIREAGGEVVCVTALFNRSDETAESLKVPNLRPLISKPLPDWPDKERCELCRAGVPIVLDVGHGEQFRKGNPDFDIEYTTLYS